jgi:hypothetical protein
MDLQCQGTSSDRIPISPVRSLITLAAQCLPHIAASGRTRSATSRSAATPASRYAKGPAVASLAWVAGAPKANNVITSGQREIGSAAGMSSGSAKPDYGVAASTMALTSG